MMKGGALSGVLLLQLLGVGGTNSSWSAGEGNAVQNSPESPLVRVKYEKVDFASLIHESEILERELANDAELERQNFQLLLGKEVSVCLSEKFNMALAVLDLKFCIKGSGSTVNGAPSSMEFEFRASAGTNIFPFGSFKLGITGKLAVECENCESFLVMASKAMLGVIQARLKSSWIADAADGTMDTHQSGPREETLLKHMEDMQGMLNEGKKQGTMHKMYKKIWQSSRAMAQQPVGENWVKQLKQDAKFKDVQKDPIQYQAALVKTLDHHMSSQLGGLYTKVPKDCTHILCDAGVAPNTEESKYCVVREDYTAAYLERRALERGMDTVEELEKDEDLDEAVQQDFNTQALLCHIYTLAYDKVIASRRGRYESFAHRLGGDENARTCPDGIPEAQKATICPNGVSEANKCVCKGADAATEGDLEVAEVSADGDEQYEDTSTAVMVPSMEKDLFVIDDILIIGVGGPLLASAIGGGTLSFGLGIGLGAAVTSAAGAVGAAAASSAGIVAMTSLAVGGAAVGAAIFAADAVMPWSPEQRLDTWTTTINMPGNQTVADWLKMPLVPLVYSFFDDAKKEQVGVARYPKCAAGYMTGLYLQAQMDIEAMNSLIARKECNDKDKVTEQHFTSFKDKYTQGLSPLCASKLEPPITCSNVGDFTLQPADFKKKWAHVYNVGGNSMNLMVWCEDDVDAGKQGTFFDEGACPEDKIRFEMMKKNMDGIREGDCNWRPFDMTGDAEDVFKNLVTGINKAIQPEKYKITVTTSVAGDLSGGFTGSKEDKSKPKVKVAVSTGTKQKWTLGQYEKRKKANFMSGSVKSKFQGHKVGLQFKYTYPEKGATGDSKLAITLSVGARDKGNSADKLPKNQDEAANYSPLTKAIEALSEVHKATTLLGSSAFTGSIETASEAMTKLAQAALGDDLWKLVEAGKDALAGSMLGQILANVKIPISVKVKDPSLTGAVTLLIVNPFSETGANRKVCLSLGATISQATEVSIDTDALKLLFPGAPIPTIDIAEATTTAVSIGNAGISSVGSLAHDVFGKTGNVKWEGDCE